MDYCRPCKLQRNTQFPSMGEAFIRVKIMFENLRATVIMKLSQNFKLQIRFQDGTMSLAPVTDLETFLLSFTLKSC